MDGVKYIMSTAVVFFSCVLCLSLIIFHGYASARVAQERAKVTYFDPKYVKNPQAFTARIRRGEAYRSNFSAAILHTWGNNITMIVTSKGKITGYDTLVKGKLCDMFKVKWLAAYIRKYMHMEPNCPLPPGSYGLYNLELPPKDFPLPLPKGEGILDLSYSFEGKKNLLQYEVKVHVV